MMASTDIRDEFDEMQHQNKVGRVEMSPGTIKAGPSEPLPAVTLKRRSLEGSV